MSKKSGQADEMVFAAFMSSKLGREREVSPLALKIALTSRGFYDSVEINERAVHDLRAEEWLMETKGKLVPIMREQTEKLADLIRERYGVGARMVDPHESGDILVPNILKEVMRDMFGGL